MLLLDTRRAIGCVVAALACVLAPGCSRQAETSTKAPSEASPRPLEGWHGLAFGMAFNEVMADLAGVEWNPAALDGCYEDMAQKGCLLSASDARSLGFEGGVPWQPMLSFNKSGQLTDISLRYRKEGGISRAECLGIHERTLDRLVKEWGGFRSSAGTRQSDGANWRRIEARTPAGNAYSIGGSAGGIFVTLPARSHWQGTAMPNPKPITEWNGAAYVSLLSWLIKVNGKPICGVSIEYSGPATLERGKIG